MASIKDLMSAACVNYYAYMFVFFFGAACVLFERVFFKKLFEFKERFTFYFISAIINLGFSFVSADFYSAFLSGRAQKYLFFAVLTVISFAAGAVVSLLLKKILILFRKKSLPCILKENVSGIAAFLILLVRYIICVPTTVDTWHIWSYTVDFSMGFSSRFLAGQILSIFCRDYVSEKDIFMFCFVAGLLLILITSILLNIAVKKADENIKPAVFFIAACFIASPINIISLFTEMNFGKLETYGLILSLLAVYLFNKIKNVPLKYAIVTALSVISIMFYQGYVFLYYNLILVIMIYDIFEETKINKNKAVCGILSVIVSFITFVKLQLFNKIIFSSADEMLKALSKRTDAEICKSPIELEYFSDLKSSYKLVTDYLEVFSREKFFLQLVLLAPVIYILLFIIFQCFHTSRSIEHTSKVLRTRNTLSFLTVSLVLPQFILNIDWGRWIIALCVFVFFFILYYAYMGDSSMKLVLVNLSNTIKEKPYIAGMFLIFISAFSAVQEWSFPDVEKIVSLIYTII